MDVAVHRVAGAVGAGDPEQLAAGGERRAHDIELAVRREAVQAEVDLGRGRVGRIGTPAVQDDRPSLGDGQPQALVLAPHASADAAQHLGFGAGAEVLVGTVVGARGGGGLGRRREERAARRDAHRGGGTRIGRGDRDRFGGRQHGAQRETRQAGPERAAEAIGGRHGTGGRKDDGTGDGTGDGRDDRKGGHRAERRQRKATTEGGAESASGTQRRRRRATGAGARQSKSGVACGPGSLRLVTKPASCQPHGS